MVLKRQTSSIIVLLLVLVILLAACERPLAERDETTGTADTTAGAAEVEETDIEEPEQEPAAGEAEEPATSEEAEEPMEEAAAETTSEEPSEDADVEPAEEEPATAEESEEPTAEEPAPESPRPAEAEAEASEGGGEETEVTEETAAEETTTEEPEAAETTDTQEEEAAPSEETEEAADAEEAVEETGAEEAAADETAEETEVAEETAAEETTTEESTGDLPATHTVALGENLYRIGLQYGISWVSIAQANNLTNANFIYAGQVLTIPGGDEGSETETNGDGQVEETNYTVQPGDSLFTIGRAFGIGWVEIAEANGLVNPNHIIPGQLLKIPGSAPGPTPEFTHVIQPGETLFTISLRYGVNWLSIAEANEIASPYVIYSGQTLVIPGG